MGKNTGNSLDRGGRFLTLVAAFFLVLAVRHAKAEGEAPEIAALRDRVELAYQARDARGLADARQGLLAAATRDDRAAYSAAYASFREGLLAEATGGAGGAPVDACVDELRGYVDRHPGDAEARALLGSCLGLSTRYHRLGMASRGLEARRHLAAARALAPANPWVVLQDGLADCATPRLFGGDRVLGIGKIERATALFADAMQAGSRLAAWGAAEAWGQLAQLYRETGRGTEAVAAAERAAELRRVGASRQLAAL